MVDVEIFYSKRGLKAFIFGPSRQHPPDMTKEQATGVAMARPIVSLPPVINKDEYITFPQERQVRSIIHELNDSSGAIKYLVRFESNHKETISFDTLLALDSGRVVLSQFEAGIKDKSDDDDNDDGLPEEGFLDDSAAQSDSARSSTNSESDNEIAPARSSTRLRETRAAQRLRPHRISRPTISDSDHSSSALGTSARRRNAVRATRSTRRSSYVNESQLIGLVDEDDESSASDINLLQSDVLPQSSRKRKRRSTRKALASFHEEVGGLKYNKLRKEPTRQSGRSTRNQQNMKEADLNDTTYRAEPEHAGVPRAVGAREAFKPLPSGHPFHLRHCQQCDTCGKWGGGPYGQLVHCQGCSLSYHKICLGPRESRDHLVSKVGEGDFVLQCRRCLNLSRRKEETAPDQSMCQVCRDPGPACAPFRDRKTALQEERDREENNGEDPIVHVNPTLINNSDNVLFRCLYCWRPFHFHHLRPRSDVMLIDGDDESQIATQRFREYAKDWKCIDCVEQTIKVSGLVAWRPVDSDAYNPGTTAQEMNEDDMEYLVRFENMSYFRCVWMPGAWVWGVTGAITRRAFAKKDNWNNLPIMNTEDAIPEDFLRIDIVLDVRFTSIVGTRAEEVDKARIREVDQALIKFKGLGYEDAVWEKVPGPQDGDRWTDFVSAYDNWVMGRYVHCPKAPALKIRLEKARATEFTTLEKRKQPDKLIGGELMQYQLDGVNWLYYRWYKMQNAILADEMGLGKTIQIIGFLATLVQDHNCFPFLLVVPNSTCPNWRREIKQWAPSLRVVTYFGSATARSLAYQHELFPEGSKELRCHVVVTSYEAAIDENCRRFFRSVPWQGLVVDEGQRLKSDKTLLYAALTALKINFKVLLTGTPLQNNARELFNLLQFLDDSFDAAALELEYAELTKENVPQLHNLIRPFFLRRTKAQVLTFLPPLAQIILPVSMSTVQTKLYQSILSRNPELIRAIFDNTRSVGKGERTNLNNILMQLRKCLCHPFVYSRDIEDRSAAAEPTVSHRNLVEASAKLQLLELLLPKLRERGHRVLIFSQFLDMLDIVEDFLDGLALGYQRLDGSMTSLQKQKRIDEFNAPESPLFAFLLSTRAGGVGINLATADTVIIMDPDFNPHQDIQALSRAHRIGQKNKVLVFQLMTRASAEERIVQVGRKKMALDHILIEQMDKEEDGGLDMESILRYGAADILEGRTQEIRYDEASIEKLLDRSQIEDTKAGEDNSAESQFSFARVWANDAASLMDSLDSDEDIEKAPDPSVWEKILSERARVAAQEAASRQQVLGRGKRTRQIVDYKTDAEINKEKEQKDKDSDSDTDFQDDKKSDADDGDDDDDEGEEAPTVPDVGDKELKEIQTSSATRERSAYEKRKGILAAIELENHSHDELNELTTPTKAPPKMPYRITPQLNSFTRAKVVWPANAMRPPPPQQQQELDSIERRRQCHICGTWHKIGDCPLKIAGPEFCNLCGLAHYGVARSCPHIRSETQVREMLLALRQSPESKEHIELARKYLSGVKGTLVQDKKREAEKAEKAANEATLRQVQYTSVGFNAVPQGYSGTGILAPPGSQSNGYHSNLMQPSRLNGAQSVPQPTGYQPFLGCQGPPPHLPPQNAAVGAQGTQRVISTPASAPSAGQLNTPTQP